MQNYDFFHSVVFVFLSVFLLYIWGRYWYLVVNDGKLFEFKGFPISDEKTILGVGIVFMTIPVIVLIILYLKQMITGS